MFYLLRFEMKYSESTAFPSYVSAHARVVKEVTDISLMPTRLADYRPN